MSKIVKEIVVITGSYTNSSRTNRRTDTPRLGSIIETAKGPMIKMDTIPLKEGGWDGWAYLNDPKPKDDGGVPHPQRNRPASNFDNMDDDIPF
jgi:hypothetical protein